MIIYIITGQSKLKALVATKTLQRVRAIDALSTNKQINQSCNSRVIKNFNDLKSSNSGVTTSEENQKECIFPGKTLFQHGKDKTISGRYKVLCFIRSKQNSWKYTFIQIDRRTVFRQHYLKEKLDMGHVRNTME